MIEYRIYLARKLGRTVAELMRTISHKELIEQYIYDGRAAQRQERQAHRARRKKRR